MTSVKLGWVQRSSCIWRNGFLALILVIGFVFAPPAAAQTPQPQRVHTLDDMLSDVARLVPDFGGMFLGENKSVLQVYLLDPSAEKARAVEAAIIQVFGRQAIPAGGIKTLKAKYGFRQLREWHRRMTDPLAGIRGIREADIDEAKNRLRIGVEAKDRARIVRDLHRLGIPREAVVIEKARSLRPLGHAGNR